MARKLSQSDPALAIEFFLSGFYTHRSQLFAPFKNIGINVVSFHDPVIDGMNMENTDLYEWQRRPGFSIFCPTLLPSTEVINQFYFFRNLKGQVIDYFDSTARLATFTNVGLNTVVAKTTTTQGYISTLGNMTYFSDGTSIDYAKYDGTNTTAWGLAAPTITPTISGLGFWQPLASYDIGDAILDLNGDVEAVSVISVPVTPLGTVGLSGKNEPIWNTTIGGTVSDGGLVWTNYGPIQIWYPITNYPTPVVILDTNGFLQLGSTIGNPIPEWAVGTGYTTGQIVTFGGTFWISVLAGTNTGIAPSSGYQVSTLVGAVTTTVPYWAPIQNPITTGNLTPVWNTTVGGITLDGNYSWQNIGQGTGLGFFGYDYVYAFRTIYGHLTTSSPFSANTGAVLGPINGAITSFAITSNVITFQGNNNFLPGNVFTVSGLVVGTYLNEQSFTITSASPSSAFPLTNVALTTNVLTIKALNKLVTGQTVTFSGVGTATFLNGVTVTVLAAGLSGTQFEANLTHIDYVSAGDVGFVNVNGSFVATFTHADVISTPDNGEALPVIASISGPGTLSALCNSTATITAVQIIANVATITASNNFQPGLWVTLTGLTNATFFNGQQFQVIAVDQPVGTQNTWFQIFFENPNYLFTPDSGTATFNAVEIYRTSDGGGIYLFTGAVTNPGGGSPAPFDSTLLLAGHGADNGAPGTYPWVNPNNVTSPASYATVAVTAAAVGGLFTVTQKASGTNLFPTTTCVATLTNPVTAGNQLLLFVLADDATIASVADNNGNIYTSIATQSVTLDGAETVVETCYLVSTPTAAATTTTVTVNVFSAQQVVMILLLEVNGLAPSAVDVVAEATALGAGTFNTGSVLTTNAADVLLSAAFADVRSALQPAGYALVGTVLGGSGGDLPQFSVASKQVAATGTYLSTWSDSNNPNWAGLTVALKLNVVNLSDGLNATTFPITIPSDVAIAGIKIVVDAKYDGAAGLGTIYAQLLRNGIPYGGIKTIIPTGVTVTYPLGSATDLWGGSWLPADITPDVRWGVQFIANLQAQVGSPFTFSIRNVNAEVYGQVGLIAWLYNDFVPNANLDVLLIAPLSHQNDPPPGAPGSSVQTAGTFSVYWQGRLWLVVGNYVYFDAGPDCTNGIPEEAWPPGNRFQFAGPVLNLKPTADGVGLLVYLADRVAAILGGPETISFYPADFLGNFGISNSNAVVRDGSTLLQFTTQKQYLELLGAQKNDIGEHIGDYLAANFDPAKSYVTVHRDGLDVGAFVSNGVDRIVRYGLNVPSWSVPAFPAFGAGALQSIETSVGIYSLMLATPAGGAQNYIYTRDLNSWGDGGTYGVNNGTAYTTCNIVIGSITLSQLGGRLFPLQHVVGYFDAVGTLDHGGPSIPDVWIMPNEVSNTAGIGFIQLPEVLQEPPVGQNQPSKSLLALRWNVNMMNSQLVSQFIHHLQVKIQFEPENAPNTIKAIAFGEDQST